jgi:hypothetical protein
MNRLRFLILLTAGAAVFGALGTRADDNPQVIIRVAGDHLDFLVGDELVGRYHKGPRAAKPYFWPLNAPGGVAVTRGWPMVPAQQGQSTDHPHQKSAWFCHGDIIPEGLDIKDKIKGIEGVDFWSEARGHGRIVCTKVDKPVMKGNHARIVTHNEWQTAGGTKILDETRAISLFPIGGARLFVFDIDLHARVCPITFGDTKEGSFGVRVSDAITETRGKGKLVNADGKVGMKECWGRRSGWCDYSGPIGGKSVGITLFDHTDNPYPACWHSRDYGLMAANPFGRQHSGFPDEKGKTDLVTLDKGKYLHFRYGMLIHPGDVKTGNVADLYAAYLKLKR